MGTPNACFTETPQHCIKELFCTYYFKYMSLEGSDELDESEPIASIEDLRLCIGRNACLKNSYGDWVACNLAVHPKSTRVIIVTPQGMEPFNVGSKNFTRFEFKVQD